MEKSSFADFAAAESTGTGRDGTGVGVITAGAGVTGTFDGAGFACSIGSTALTSSAAGAVVGSGLVKKRSTCMGIVNSNP